MESHAKILGHAIHPMLIVFPLGLFSAGVIFDAVYLFNNELTFANVAYWNIAGGIVGGLLAAVFGAWDWAHIPAGTRAKSIGVLHGVGNVVIVALFAVSLLMRMGDPAHLPGAITMALEIVAVGLALVTGWLGGELVERLGVGVDPGAELNAPSSLSNEPLRGRVVRTS